MNNPTPVFEFGSFVLNPPERLLLREGRPVEMPPKVFDLLLALVRARGHLLEKEELLRTVWEGSFVEEGNVNRQISTLRRILGDAAGSGGFIETVPKRGYRFIAPVRQIHDGETVPLSVTAFETPPAIHTPFDHLKDSKDSTHATPRRRAI
ncbi:MAG: transcriptional regulator, partial [Pyrinomonadaceae bacterium]